MRHPACGGRLASLLLLLAASCLHETLAAKSRAFAGPGEFLKPSLSGKILPGGRQGAGMVWSSGRVVVFGGVSEGVYLGDMHIYDAQADFWYNDVQTVSAPPSARSNMGFAEVQGQAFLFGGMDSEGTKDDFWCLDIGLLTWTQVDLQSNAGPLPGKRHSMGFAAVGSDKILLFGGRSDDEVFGDLFLFSVSNYEFQHVNPVLPGSQAAGSLLPLPSDGVEMCEGYEFSQGGLHHYTEKRCASIGCCSWDVTEQDGQSLGRCTFDADVDPSQCYGGNPPPLGYSLWDIEPGPRYGFGCVGTRDGRLFVLGGFASSKQETGSWVKEMGG